MPVRHRAGPRPGARVRPVLLCGAAALGLAAALPAQAQTTPPAQSPAGAPTSATPPTAQGSELSEVVVTARRREESGQRVPQTVTALTPQLLKQQNIQTVSDLTYAAPSLSVASAYTSLNSSFTVRGLPTGVTTYFADAPCCGAAANQPFLDIASVQVLNGPQGTLFGRSSAAGAVLIDPAHPDLDHVSGYVEAIVGNYSRGQFTGVFNLPIIPGHVALRFAANSNSIDGYTREIGTNNYLDGVNNQQYRLSFEVKYGGFDNYTVGQHFNLYNSTTSELLGGSDLNYGLYKIPDSYGPAYFGALCAQAVSYGFSKDAQSCITQRVNILHQIQSTLVSESQRLAGGGGAVRYTLPSYDRQLEFNREKRDSLVNTTRYDFGELPLIGKVNIRNIFSLDSFTSMIASPTDGLGGIGEESSFTETNGDGGSNQVGNRMTAVLPPRQFVYNDEFQIRGDVRNGLFVWTMGDFYSYAPVPKNLNGTGVVYKIFGGLFTPNLGYNAADGFQSGSSFGREEAAYGQGTLNLDKVGIHGLSLTGGFRYSWDHGIGKIYPEQINYPSGVITPSATLVRTETRSDGYNYTVSAQEQVTRDLMVYYTQSRAYVPGGINPLNSGTSAVPNYTRTFLPETVLNREFGIKSEFRFGPVAGRVNVAAYFDDFTNIVEAFVGTNGSTSFVYYENAAAASLNGLEFGLTLIPFEGVEIDGSYNYNNQSYDKWVGQDPFNKAQPGDPLCLPSSPSGSCYLDLSKNPPYLSPQHQGHVTVRYRLPVDDRFGKVSVSGTVYAQSRVFYEATAYRDLQIKPDDLGAISQAPYALVNFRADWRDMFHTGWDAAAFVNNVTDEVYAAGKVSQTITLGFAIANYAPPRMFGFEFSRKFGGGS